MAMQSAPSASRAPYLLSLVLVGLMAVQALLGLLFRTEYRDAEWIAAAWYGNDWFTLIVGVPLLAAALTARYSVRGRLLWFGMLGYAVYNYAYYLFGAALNVFFPVYVLACVVSSITLILVLARTDVEGIAATFDPATPVRLIGGYLTVVGTCLGCVWLAMWAAYAFAGRATPVEPEAFKLVAALDLTMMVTALVSGGVLIWRRRPWGYVIASVAALQGSLYLMVLTLNSLVAINRGLVKAPGELPVWGTLAGLTSLAAMMLLARVRGTENVHRQIRPPSAQNPWRDGG
jgi:hypothetical protein